MKNQPKAVFKLSAYALTQVPQDRKPQVAFGGRSNVGKSSLINKILGQKRLCKTSSTPGRTQALNFFEVDDKYYFVDLPGYGYARAPKSVREQWGKLTDEYLADGGTLSGMVCLIDSRRDLTDYDRHMFEWLADNEVLFTIVLTKCDKLSGNKLAQAIRKINIAVDGEVIPFSAVTGRGAPELWKWIREAAGQK
ncbi:YihA family ribosome biogenesis GTP-binding protein [bacterium AH-315-J21]|nr:YihA family ribosome biogenesis GTP-binding protein [bacterium AH-315-J21]